VSAKFLDDDARAAFGRAIHAIESESAAEVVIAVRRRSHDYHGANAIGGTVVAFAGLAMMLFSHHPFSLLAILLDPFVVGIATAGLIELLPGVKRILTSVARRGMFVRRAARATFVERGVHGAQSRTGLLVYISWLEQQVVLVPDLALERAIAHDALAQAERDMSRAMGSGGAAVAAILEKLSAELGKAMPRRHDDVNELSNEIDSDLARPS
jgi:putative membrane protein